MAMYLPQERAEEYLILRNNPAKTMEELLEYPTYFTIEPTGDCNAACRMCALAHNMGRFMEDDMFMSLMDEIGPNSAKINQITIQGRGEPLLELPGYMGIADKVDLISNTYKIKTSMATNVSLLTPSLAEDLLDANLGSLIISIDSLNKEVYEKIRRKLIFEEVLENTLNFIEMRNKKGANTQVRLRMVQQTPNSNEWEEYKEYWEPYLRKTDRLTVKKVHNWGTKLKIKDVKELKTDMAHFPCHGLWGTFNIMYNGDVILCPGDSANQTALLGNVTTESIKEIYCGKKLDKIRQQHLKGNKVPNKWCATCKQWAEPSDFNNIGQKLFPELYEENPEYINSTELCMREEPANVHLTSGEKFN